MSIPSNAVKVCDLTNGRIVLDPESIRILEGTDQVQLTITDTDKTIHEHSLHVNEGVIDFPRPTLALPIRRFHLSRPGDGQIIFEARNLFPSTDREFETQFKSHRDRSGDRHIDYFVANQIFHRFTGQEGYRISAAVVAAYKSIELMESACLDAAEKMLVDSLSAIPSVKLARSTRNNREHLHISVLCALYHVHLAQGNSLEFLRTLKIIKDLLDGQNFNSYYNLAYNGALSLRLLTLLQLLADRPEDARATSSLSFRVFKFAARDADENLAHFKELKYVHDNTYETMRIARRVKEVTESLVQKTLKGCLRVGSEDHPGAFSVMHETYRQSAADFTRLGPVP